MGDEIRPVYRGIINHDKDPYYTTSIMESKRVVFVAQMVFVAGKLRNGPSFQWHFEEDFLSKRNTRIS